MPVKKTPIAITEVLTSAPATSGDTSCPSLPQAEARPKPEPRSDGGKASGVTTYMSDHTPPKKSANEPYTPTNEVEANSAGAFAQ